jgi:hypothetical protein
MASKIGAMAVATAFAFVVCGVAVRPVLAEHGDHYRGRGRYHENRHYGDRHQWRHRGGYEYQPGVTYYAPSPYVYYAPPPVVYVPPRPSWGINLFFPLRIR